MAVLLSMTGHGDAQVQIGGVSVSVEVRTINNRYFKLAVRADERYAALESQIEDVVRRFVRRGTIQVEVRVDREPSPEDYQLNETILAAYIQQFQRIQRTLGMKADVEMSALTQLPGVVDERGSRRRNVESDWTLIEQALVLSLEKLAQMRTREGLAMAADLRENRRQIAAELHAIEALAPRVVEHYRQRLLERLNKFLDEHGIQVQPADIVREVGLFAERSDVAEEIVRLHSHLEQFDQILDAEESNGRKLEFLTQEMFRETNTIGSKANDSTIARHVIEIKATIERIREMIQNVE